MAFDGSQPLWLGCWLLTKAKVAKSPTKGTRRREEESRGEHLLCRRGNNGDRAREGGGRREIYTAVSDRKRVGNPRKMARAPAVQDFTSRALVVALCKPSLAETLNYGIPPGPSYETVLHGQGLAGGGGRQQNRCGLHPGSLVQLRASYQTNPC
jgi:hypothetical protein